MKRLHMIGNSHIDPVWFWGWEEGMQEVRATFASAVERMEEFPAFHFTATSALFFRWVERVDPALFEAIRRRVAEGRWELTGGWLIEPDCILPHGEAFVRQGLYGQRYFYRTFGKICRAGSNVDSFGHAGTLPQILCRSGMDRYVFMRPRTSDPVFRWEGPDGSSVTALSLPGEYTTWFREPTKKNIRDTIERSPGWDEMACCYGVGNHGGGPTVENIRSVEEFGESFPNTELLFSTFGAFFDAADGRNLPTKTGSLEKVNEGCYSIDAAFKKENRLAEKRLIRADTLLSIAAAARGEWAKEAGEIEPLWETLLFNQFHDTLGGTAIREARDEALRQMSSAAQGAGRIIALSMQDLAGALDTRGDGYPLLLVNPHGYAYDGLVDFEAEWFCQTPLRIRSPEGDETPYQRINTHAKVTHTTLGGRRRFLMHAHIPAGGYALYRLEPEEPASAQDCRRDSGHGRGTRLDNGLVRVRFDPLSGTPCALTDLSTGYEGFAGPAAFQIWTDERDAWGGRQGRHYGDSRERFALESIDRVESGFLRSTVRAVYRYHHSWLEILYRLGEGERFLTMEGRLWWNEPWKLLKIAFPAGIDAPLVRAEAPYGVQDRRIADTDEYFMHRFADIRRADGAGLALADDTHGAFHYENGAFHLTVVRSAIWAQGNSLDWYNERESYAYTDIGEHTFTILLRPHGGNLSTCELIRMADRAEGPCEALLCDRHPGLRAERWGSFFSVGDPGAALCVVKKAEDDDGAVLRLLETEGKPCKTVLHCGGDACTVELGPHELLTLRFDPRTRTFCKRDLIEWDAFL